MQPVVASIDLAVPAPFAFAFLADPSTARIIDPAVVAYEPDRVPMGVGAEIAIRFRMWGVPVSARSRVEAWEPGARMVMVGIRPTRPVRVTAEHRFEPTELGCRYTWTITTEPTAWWGRPAARLMARFWAANASGQQGNLRREVEVRWAAQR